MKRYQLSKAGVSATEGIQRFNGDKEMYEEVLQTFVQDESFQKLCEALEQKNITAAFAAAHSLKGVAGNLSMNRLYDDIAPLVEILRAGSMEGTEGYMETVVQDYEAVIQAIQA